MKKTLKILLYIIVVLIVFTAGFAIYEINTAKNSYYIGEKNLQIPIFVYHDIVKDKSGLLCDVIVNLKMNRDYVMFLLDKNEDADNAVASVQTLLMYLHDSRCVKSYEIDLCTFTKSYLIENSLDCDPIFDVVFNRKDKNDDDIFVAPPELKYIDENGSKITVLENLRNKIR